MMEIDEWRKRTTIMMKTVNGSLEKKKIWSVRKMFSAFIFSSSNITFSTMRIEGEGRQKVWTFHYTLYIYTQQCNNKLQPDIATLNE